VGHLLQRVADGEASVRDLARYERLLAKDPALAAEVAEIRRLSSLMAAEVPRAAREVDFRAMQARVLRSIDAPASARVSAWERLRMWVRYTLVPRPAAWAPTLALAVAAGMALVVPRLAGEPSGPPEAHVASHATQIHALDTQSQTAVVFETPASGLTVIWLAMADVSAEDGDDLDPEARGVPGVPAEVKAALQPSPDVAQP
jgi:anti-sigma factor RsiW